MSSTCTECGTHLSKLYVRVRGDNDGEATCPACTPTLTYSVTRTRTYRSANVKLA